ncbi:hypothetical protein BRADI_1g28586v3 [Brachypodium distachyon]|uniref:Uncharacterized protein n=1 Tax=Brachypodium distachyon TaxID=15368 RepID=A0A2K2DLP0_BRADI|nr:hypothetical protein BRADI_1g28586v3 [Brachypodium distachyon]
MRLFLVKYVRTSSACRCPGLQDEHRSGSGVRSTFCASAIFICSLPQTGRTCMSRSFGTAAATSYMKHDYDLLFLSQPVFQIVP